MSLVPGSPATWNKYLVLTVTNTSYWRRKESVLGMRLLIFCLCSTGRGSLTVTCCVKTGEERRTDTFDTRSHTHTGRMHCPTCNKCDLPNHSCDTRYVLLAVFMHSDSSRHFSLLSLGVTLPPHSSPCPPSSLNRPSIGCHICGSLEHKRRDCPEKHLNKKQRLATTLRKRRR